MSDKETAPWIKKVAAEICGDGKIYIRGGLSKLGWPHSESGWVDADELAQIVAGECTAPAPQPAPDAELTKFGEWLGNFASSFAGHINDESQFMAFEAWLCRARLAATPQVTQELELEWEADGHWLAEFTRFPGALAYGPSKEEAIRNAAKVLIEPEQASPTPEKCPGHECGTEIPHTTCVCVNCGKKKHVADPWHSSAPKSRNTGISLDGGKTIHSKFKND